MISLDKYQIDSLDSFVRGAGRIVIVVHTHPDGDAIGSGLALRDYLLRRGVKDVALILPDACPDSLSFLPGVVDAIDASVDLEAARSAFEGCDLLFCLDHNRFSRTGCVESLLLSCDADKILIDHHPDPDRRQFRLVFSETQLSSTCELLFYMLSEMPDMQTGAPMPLPMASLLMAGMTTDTNNFANSVFPSTFKMASVLLDAGVDRDDILSHLYNRYRENRYRAMGAFLEKLMHITPEGVAYVVMTSDVFRDFDLREHETEGFVNLPLGIESVKMSVFLREDDGFFGVSVRSKNGWSANSLAQRYFHGGGHECAAGGRLFFPQDIPAAGQAAEYIETVTARFMQNEAAV